MRGGAVLRLEPVSERSVETHSPTNEHIPELMVIFAQFCDYTNKD